jgi:hypothetical protein
MLCFNATTVLGQYLPLEVSPDKSRDLASHSTSSFHEIACTGNICCRASEFLREPMAQLVGTTNSGGHHAIIPSSTKLMSILECCLHHFQTRWNLSSQRMP